MRTRYKHLDTITAFFTASLLISNLLSSAKLVDLGVSLFSIPLIFDGGLLVFPICYIFGDILTEVYGYKRSRKVIWLGFFTSILLVGMVKLLSYLPAEAGWQNAGGLEGYQIILYGLYSGGLVLASMLAYLSGEFLNSIVLARLKVMFAGKLLRIRFILSTLVGQFFDTAIFLSVACLLNIFPFSLWISLFITNYVLKILVEVIFLPFTVRLVAFLKKAENEDYYDKKTNFNPFIFGN
ncbi:MAG: queuosine precursor transporter [SAR324 cluster bacterium]|nr:queuosine precursor transporter [SAR324 cluster bacterium]